MASTEEPNRLIYAQAQEYTLRLFSYKKARVFTICLVVLLNSVHSSLNPS
jgi:hypothetical protein